MKKMRKRILLGITLLIICICIGSTVVQAETTKAITATSKTAVKKGWVNSGTKRYYYVNGKKVINTWKTISKKRYYFGSDGAMKKGWQTISKKKYYFGSDGVMKTGWYSIGSKSYYFNSQGVYVPSKTKAMDKTLLAKTDQIIKAAVSSKDSSTTKLKKLFNYVQKNYSYGRVMNFTGKSGWHYTYAKEIMTKKKGSCYHYAAAYAVLAKRATGLPVRICWGTSNAFNARRWQKHGWVEIKIGSTWYTFDPNAAKYSTLRTGKWYMQKLTAMEGKIYKREKYVNVEL